MNLTSRKSVSTEIERMRRLLDYYSYKETIEFIAHFSAGEYQDAFEKQKKILNEIIAKLQQIHDEIPYGRIYQGAYYVKDSFTKIIHERKDPLFLRGDLVRWQRVINKYQYNFVAYPYTDPQLNQILKADAGRFIYSEKELREIVTDYEAAEQQSKS
ncbi:MAG: hypothetical protein HQK53_11745 [Oligoflexia bacterium]|nr:hypothetical protein [Oligoflexia bacterium]